MAPALHGHLRSYRTSRDRSFPVRSRGDHLDTTRQLLDTACLVSEIDRQTDSLHPRCLPVEVDGETLATVWAVISGTGDPRRAAPDNPYDKRVRDLERTGSSFDKSSTVRRFHSLDGVLVSPSG
ncbi:tRNA pseudouridine synthase A [Anopheles sinensis]|uniref:tRNA pseudouridine synthase A n=1 Tax=Anopheles sinensis TaxID=74873 RepID=A0A084VR02_ANOSI|nr:tRNA pseudouridine synthase A [Anopheles sinensis]